MPRGRQSAEPLWRAIAVFRFAGLGYAVLLTAVINRAEYARLGWAWVVIAVMTAWTVATTMAYARPERRTRLLLSTDLVVTAGLLLSTAALQYPAAMARGVMPVTGIALSVGFSNISHFRRLFRRRYGVAPGGLRAVAR